MFEHKPRNQEQPAEVVENLKDSVFRLNTMVTNHPQDIHWFEQNKIVRVLIISLRT
jgi:hypothetical protein